MLNVLGLKNYVGALRQKKIMHFIKLQFLFVIIFALAYHFADRFLYAYPELGKRLGLGEATQVDDLYSYTYFSLITQSGVGFGGILPDGNNIITTKSNLVRLLSLLQLSVVLIMFTWSV